MNLNVKKSIIEQIANGLTSVWDSLLQEYRGLTLGEQGGAAKRYPDGTIVLYGNAEKGRL